MWSLLATFITAPVALASLIWLFGSYWLAALLVGMAAVLLYRAADKAARSAPPAD